MPAPQARYWLLTIPVAHYPEVSILPPVVYIKGQKEVGTENGLVHWQLLVICSKKVTMRALKACFVPQAHCEPSRSSAAEDYVWKEDTRVPDTQFEMGARPMNRSSKTDWDDVLSKVKQGRIDETPADVQVRYYNSLKRIVVDNMVNVPRPEIDAQFFWGVSGSGKTRAAWDQAGLDAYIKNPNTKWWDGYRNQENVIIDEFTGRIDISYLLTWLDRYPCTVEVKGYSVPLRAIRFWITSNLSIEECYPDAKDAQIQALRRRLRVTHYDVPFRV